MKVEIYIKDPDGFYESVEEAVKASLKDTGLPDDEQDALYQARMNKTWKAMEKWVEYNECVTIEFDTDAGTATVKPKGT